LSERVEDKRFNVATLMAGPRLASRPGSVAFEHEVENMKALALRHLAFEDLGAWGPALARRGWEIAYHDAGVDPLEAHDPLDPDLLIVLGGPIGVYETEDYPFLTAEIDFIRARIEADRPTMGVCLGAQLLAAAAGAHVYPTGTKEIGFLPIDLTEAGRRSCLSPFQDDPTTLHWHGDTFDLPQGAVHLASTHLVPNQAFMLGRCVLALQFHPEWGGHPIEPWLIGHSGELRAEGADISAFRGEAAALRARLAAKAERVLGLFLRQCGLE